MKTTDGIKWMPDFRLPASTGQTLEADAFRAKIPLVIFFLDDLDSNDDLVELTQFDQILHSFGEARTQVLAVASKTAKEIRSITGARGIDLPVLADPNEDMRRDYGDPARDARRFTVVVDSAGRIVETIYPVTTAGHAAEVLNIIRRLAEDPDIPMSPQL